MLHEGPWNGIDQQVTQINRKGNSLLGLVATKDRGYLPPAKGYAAMLGKVDQMRSMLGEIERIVKTLNPEGNENE